MNPRNLFWQETSRHPTTIRREPPSRAIRSRAGIPAPREGGEQKQMVPAAKGATTATLMTSPMLSHPPSRPYMPPYQYPPYPPPPPRPSYPQMPATATVERGHEIRNIQTQATNRMAVPEYMQHMSKRVKKNRLEKRIMLNDTETRESDTTAPEYVQKDTAPNIIPFDAKYLTLNLAPPHGNMPPPPPPPRHRRTQLSGKLFRPQSLY